MDEHESTSTTVNEEEDPLDVYMRQLAAGGAAVAQVTEPMREPRLHDVEWRPRGTASLHRARNLKPLRASEAPAALFEVCADLAAAATSGGSPSTAASVLESLEKSPEAFLRTHGGTASDEQLRTLHAAYAHTHPGQAAALEAALSVYHRVRRNRRYRALQRMLCGSADAVDPRYFTDAAMRERDSPLFKSMLGDAGEEEEREDDEDIPEEGVHGIAATAAALYQSPQGSLLAAGVSAAELRRMTAASAAETRTAAQDARVHSASYASTGLSRMLLSAMDRGSAPADADAEDDVAIDSAAAAVHADLHASVTRRRKELVQIMAERFLDGCDGAFFEYARVDRDDGLDVSAQSAADAEEAYFASQGGVAGGDDEAMLRE